MQALVIVFGAVWTLLTAGALGRLVLRRKDVAALQFLTGAAVLSAIVFLICAVRLAYPATFLALGVAALIASPPQPSLTFKLPRGLDLVFTLACTAYFIVGLANAMAPEISPDGSAYHLGLTARYIREHGFVRLTTNMYASLSQGIEMLFTMAFAFGRHPAAALVHFAFLPALAGAIRVHGRRAGYPRAATCAALLVFASPAVMIDAISAYNDVALAAVAFGLFALLEIWDEERDAALLIPIGLLAGFAYAIKYTGGLAIPYALGFVAWKLRRAPRGTSVRGLAVTAACAAAMAAPWMLKNWLWVGNPVAPFFNHLFPNPYVLVSFEREYARMLSQYGLASRWQLPLQVTTYGDLSGLLGPVFLLAPLALLALVWKSGRRVLAAALVFACFYFSNVGTRFLIPALPFIALAMMLVFDRVRGLALAVALVHVVISWYTLIPRYAHAGAWHIRRVPWKYALGLRPADQYLAANLQLYNVARMIEQSTRPGETVFTYRPLPEAYTTRNIHVEYQAAANKIDGVILWTPLAAEFAPTWRLRFGFPRQSLRALRVVQTNSGPHDLWAIHEFRIHDQDRELTRDPRWRLTGDPYPWGLPYAFDNSLLTFWLCGEWIRPGQYVRVDFNALEAASDVVLETSPNQAGIRLRLEGMDERGQWRVLSPAPVISDAPRPLGLARAAAEELKRRGNQYILVFESDLGAGEISRSLSSWGLTEAGACENARLYRLP